MTTERKHYGWLITDIVNGQLIKQMYSGYNKRTAQRLFRQYRKQIKK